MPKPHIIAGAGESFFAGASGLTGAILGKPAGGPASKT